MAEANDGAGRGTVRRQSDLRGLSGEAIRGPRQCVGCPTCMVVCPYMARYYDYEAKAVDGCDFCYQSRLKNGKQPACVEACPHKVLFHGDLLRPADPVVELMEGNKGALWLMRSEKGCRSNVLYVSNVRTKEG